MKKKLNRNGGRINGLPSQLLHYCRTKGTESPMCRAAHCGNSQKSLLLRRDSGRSTVVRSGGTQTQHTAAAAWRGERRKSDAPKKNVKSSNVSLISAALVSASDAPVPTRVSALRGMESRVQGRIAEHKNVHTQLLQARQLLRLQSCTLSRS
jgi:hypothetical protein